MLSVFDGLRSVTTLSVFVRLACAFICGGIIGIERSYKRRPAGFRTHILICIGAAITTLTSQYLYLNMHYFTDMARLGAQVVAGIGFIGAGTIIVTKRQNVKGLTTAAEINVYMEYEDKTCLDDVLQLYRSCNVKVLNIQITRAAENEEHNACAIFTLRLPRSCTVNRLMTLVGKRKGIVSVEEL